MGVVSEENIMDSEKKVDATIPDGNHSKVRSDVDFIPGGHDEERASPVSSTDDGSNTPRDRSVGSLVAAVSSMVAPTEKFSNGSNHETGQPAVTDTSLQGGTTAAHASFESQENYESGNAVRRNSRSVSQQNCDLKATTAGAGCDTAIATSYQSLEDKLRSEQAAAPSSGQSAKSGLDTDAGDDEERTTLSAEAPISGDGPPRIITTKPTPGMKKSGHMRRRGKWTVEEEAYVARVIQDFNSGFLDAPAGTTLRTFLSDKLNCDPMRITKKFTGEACIGKRVFHPAIRSPSNAGAIDKAQAELEDLERRWRRRMEMQQRESAKKAAASAAAAAAAASSVQQYGGIDESTGAAIPQNPILQTAEWLDRAKTMTSLPTDSIEALPRSEVMNQMKEVQKLLNEGSTMRRTNTGVPQYVDQTANQGLLGTTSGTESPPQEPADKRLRTGAEDAEALVGFLRSVRASAAASASGRDF